MNSSEFVQNLQGFVPQLQLSQEGNISDDSCWPDTRQWENVLVTHFRGKYDLHHLPADSYVVIETNWKTTETPGKPASLAQSVEGRDGEVILSSTRPCTIYFKVYMSLELGIRRGNGILLGRFKTFAGDALDRNEKLQLLRFLEKNPFSLYSTLGVAIKRRIYDANECTTRLSVPMSDTMSHLAQLANTAQNVLLRYSQAHDQGDLQQAIVCFEHDRCITPLSRPNHPVTLFTLATAVFVRCQDHGDYYYLGAAITLYQHALRLHTSNNGDCCLTALDLCFALLSWLHDQGNIANMARARDSRFEVVESCAYRVAWLALQMAGISLPMNRIQLGILQGDRANPDDEDLTRRTRAMFLGLSDGDARQHALLATLGCLLYRRLDGNGDLVCIHEGILVFKQVVQLTPDEHPWKPTFLCLLGNLLFRRFQRLGNISDINKSISVGEEAVRLAPNGHPNGPTSLNNLGNSLLSRFHCIADIADANKSVLMLEEAVRLTPDGHPDKPGMLGNLGNSLFRRFERFCGLTDIHKSISMHEEAVRLTPDGHPDRPGILGNLGNSLFRRFERLGDLADIHKSVSMHEEAVRLTPNGHPGKSCWLNNLGNSLSRRFGCFGDIADINKSILMKDEAVRLTPNGHPDKPGMLNNLGNSLIRRFTRLGDLADINRSLLVLEEALCLISNDHPLKPTLLINLGNSFLSRFEHLGDLADINKSISVKEEAVGLAPWGHPDKPVWLDSVGSSLLNRFDSFGGLADIDRSISVREEAIHLTLSGDPDKPGRLSNLGNSLLRRFEHLGNLADIHRSISMHEEAVRLTPNGHASRLGRLNNLGNSLSRRFERLGDITDIQRSIALSEEAVRITPDGHPHKPGLLNNLGNGFKQSFTHFGDPLDLSAATLYFSVASRASAGPTSVRFHASRCWISSARLEGNPRTLLDAYATAISLLPQLAWLGFPLARRHHILPDAAQVVRDAAAAALEAGFPEKAVEWLEKGRSVVWSQLLQLRTPVDELRVTYPALAYQFQQVSQQLEHASARDDVMISTLPEEEEVQRHHDLALRREKLLVKIRSLPGFDRFLLPKTIEQLTTLIDVGHVIYLNASERCDALIVDAKLKSATSVPLSSLSFCEVELLERILRLSLQQNRLIISRAEISALICSEDDPVSRQFLDSLLVPGGSNSEATGIARAVKFKPQRTAGYTPDDLVQHILAYLWNCVVNPILQALGSFSPLPSAEEKARVFWCPTGPFTFLPIHAAGLYDTAEVGTKLSDFAISSYIPTLGALASSPQKDSNDGSSHIRLVTVPQPPTDGLNGLLSVKEEIEHVKRLSTRSPFVTLQDSDGTVEDVMEKMTDADWVHFACHGTQDPHHPLDSGLGLANGRRLKLSDIIRLSRPQGGLAFLSACQTAQGDPRLSEESVHLAAGMLLAGYGGVIATMWAIRDDDAPRVTKDVYEHLFRDGKVPDSTEVAEALHGAVQHLRDSGAPFTSWVPFIHVGR